MLTRATIKNQSAALNETTFMTIFKKLGFKVSWYGTQSLLKYYSSYSTYTLYDEPQNLVLPGGSLLFKMNAHDEVLLPFLDKSPSISSKNLIILHTSGSHWNYEFRYPDDFNIFKPGCSTSLINKRDPSTCSHDGLINIYDNSIIYTDYFIAQVIEKFKSKNAIIIYASDHGQFLGENGKFMHGNLGNYTKEQYNIPIIFWVSETFKQKNSKKWQNIVSHKGHRLSHDYIFHSILDCSSINSSSNIIEDDLSVCKQYPLN